MHRAPLLEKGTGPTRNGGQKKRPRGTLFRVQGGSLFADPRRAPTRVGGQQKATPCQNGVDPPLGSQGLTTDARPRASVVSYV